MQQGHATKFPEPRARIPSWQSPSEPIASTPFAPLFAPHVAIQHFNHGTPVEYVSRWLGQNPATVSDFVDYNAVHWHKFITAYANGDQTELERWPALREAYLNVKDRFREDKCPQCERTPPSSWTKLSTDAMARKVGMIEEYAFCFLIPTLLLHVTHWGNERALNTVLESGDSTLSNILLAVHRLLVEAIWIFRPFSNTPLASEVIEKLVDDFRAVWLEAY